MTLTFNLSSAGILLTFVGVFTAYMESPRARFIGAAIAAFIGQPFWFRVALSSGDGNLFLASIIFTVLWGRGVWENRPSTWHQTYSEQESTNDQDHDQKRPDQCPGRTQ